MWLIFIMSMLVIFIVAMFLIWIGNKIYISIKKDNLNFKSEKENEK